MRAFRYDILTCECGEKHFTMEGMDNAYNCYECKRDITNIRPIVFLITDNDISKVIEENFTGKPGKAYSEE